MSARPAVSVVVPMYREGAHVERLLDEVAAAVGSVDGGFEVVLVDDGSPDDTWAAIGRAREGRPFLRALRLSRNFGKEHALVAGIEAAEGAAVVTIDGDLQHPPALIPEMVAIWRDGGADIVEAVKTTRGKESLSHRMGARLFYALLSALSGHDLRGSTDFKLLDRRVVDVWRTLPERNLFFRGMVAWLGFRRATVDFDVPDRVGGESRWSLLRLVRLALTGVVAYSSVPLQIVTAFGGLFFVFAVVLGAQTLYNKIAGNAVSGFTTVILLQLLIGSLVLLGLGVLGTYIDRMYREVKRRPRYVVLDRIEGGGRE